VCCCVLQCVAAEFVMGEIPDGLSCILMDLVAVCCRVLPCVAACCRVLQCVASQWI